MLLVDIFFRINEAPNSPLLIPDGHGYNPPFLGERIIAFKSSARSWSSSRKIWYVTVSYFCF